MNHFSFTDWILYAFHTVLAALGGGLGYAMREHDKGAQLSWGRASLEVVGSGFVGFLVMLLCKAMGINPLYSGFIVGIMGWLGASASIRLLERLAYNKLGLEKNAGEEQ